MPPQFVSNSTITKAQYIAGLTTDKGQFLPDGVMPAGGPKTVYAMEKLIGVDVTKVTIANTFTNTYAMKANKIEGHAPHDAGRRRRLRTSPFTTRQYRRDSGQFGRQWSVGPDHCASELTTVTRLRRQGPEHV